MWHWTWERERERGGGGEGRKGETHFRDKERERECVCVCVCVWERERERERSDHLSHLISSRLCPSTAGCSPPSMSSIFVCLLLSSSRWFPPSLLCHLAIFCLVVLSSSSLSLAATLCIALSTYCPLILLYDRPISTFVSVCILWYRWPLFFFWFPSMVSYLLALGLTFSFPLLFERFSVCLSFVYLETMFGSHRSWLARYIGRLPVF